MNKPISSPKALLSGGFYTLSEAGRILGIKGIGKIRNWLTETPGGVSPAIISDFEKDNGVKEINFWELIEIRFINYFRENGVSAQSIRKAATAARNELKHKHPFALSNVKFVTDRKRIFLQSAEITGDKSLLDIINNQSVMYPVIEEYLAKGISFDPSSGLAKRWHPDPDHLPAIVIDPKIAHGKPTIESEGIPTEAIFLTWRAEGQNTKKVSKWFNVSPKLVKQAISYEQSLAA